MALTPIKAIRAKCLECCAGQYHEVRFCKVKGCALYEYRFGHRPRKDEPKEESTEKGNND